MNDVSYFFEGIGLTSYTVNDYVQRTKFCGDGLSCSPRPISRNVQILNVEDRATRD